MSVAGALTRVSCLAATIGCTASADPVMPALNSAERIVGRAVRQDGTVVILTNEPAIVTVRAEANEISRTPIQGPDRAGARLWGLAERDNALYSISGFNNLVRLTIEPPAVGVRLVTRLVPPVGNLVDTAGGMVAQLAVDDPGKALAWWIDASGRLTEMRGPAREALGLSRAEESLLHLLSCSVPPRILCWLPGSRELLTIDDEGLRPIATLASFRLIAPSEVLARPDVRSIDDAMWIDDDLIAVLTRRNGKGAGSLVAEFRIDGALHRQYEPQEPLRMFVSIQNNRLVGLARSGRLMEVAR